MPACRAFLTVHEKREDDSGKQELNSRHLLLAGLLLIVACTALPPPRVDNGTAAAAERSEVLPDNPDILFWTPAQTAVGFRSIEKVSPGQVRTVSRGPSVKPLPQAAGPELEIAFEHDGVHYTTASYMAQQRVSGIIVVKNGRVVLERYGLGRRPDDRWMSFSVTKSLTSTLIGAAIKDGFISSLDDTLDQYVSEMKGSVYAGVTVRQLLTMSSGVRWNEDYTDPNSDVARAGQVQFEGEASPILSYMRRLERAQPAGSTFLYSTGETDLAGIVLSRAVGKTMSEYLSEKIWAGYGMEQDAVWLTDTSGHERGGCCVNMTLRDYARIGLFMLEDGAGITPAGWVSEATRAHFSLDSGAPTSTEPETNRLKTTTPHGYGYFWWVNDHGFDAIGIFGQMIHVDPEQQLVIAINSAWPAATGAQYSAARVAFVEAVTAAALAQSTGHP